MGFLWNCRRIVRAYALILLCVACPFFAYPATLDPGVFNTAAIFSVDHDAMTLTTGVATIEPRVSAPGYSWLKIHFYSFPVASEDIPGILNGDMQSMEKKWTKKSENPREYNHSTATIQLSVDKDFKVWQVDMAVPGHACTIAPFEKELRYFLQEYQFDGKRLKLKSNGTYECDMKFMGLPNENFSWEIDLDLPVFERQNPKK